MKKTFKYILLMLFIGYILFNLIIYSFAFLYSNGAGGIGKIREYEFRITADDFQKELKLICYKSKNFSYKDTVVDDGYKRTMITIQIVKNYEKIIYFLELQDSSDQEKRRAVLYLINLDGRKNDDFGWLSMEKYKKIKLFEESIVKPLSEKYKRVEEN